MIGPVTEDEIRRLVFTFYGRVRDDEVLGPVFEARLAGRWPEHLEKMCDFWSTILLATGRYRGDPQRAHAGLPGLEPHHFRRWMDLFEATAADVLAAPAARDVQARAARMRRVLERAAFGPHPLSST